MPARPNSSNTGKGFEALLDKIHAAYEGRGIASLSKAEPPVKIIGGGLARKIIPMRNPFVDYIGAWHTEGGRALFIEAKSTAEPRLPVGGDDGLKLQQVESLNRWHRAGAAVGVLWLHAADVRLVSLDIINAQRSRKSITWDEADVIPPGPGFIIYDYLSLLTWRAATGTRRREDCPNWQDVQNELHEKNPTAKGIPAPASGVGKGRQQD